MPKSLEDPRIGKTSKIPKGWKGRCGQCGKWSATDGSERGKIVAGERFNGKFHMPTGKVAVYLACPSCGYKAVQYSEP